MSDNGPLISVIINCYDGEKYLSETIKSVLSQSYNNWEIIFWDNQSTDNSVKVVSGFSDDRIQCYYAPEHTKLGKARNLAIEKTTGDWCAFLDSDDVWLPDKLQKQVDIIVSNNNELGLVYGQMLVHNQVNGNSSEWSDSMIKYSDKTMLKSLPEGDIFEQLLKINFIPLLTAIFRRELFYKIGGISEQLEIAEDYDLFLKLSHITRVRAVQAVVALYRVHENNISIGKQEQDFSETMVIVNRYLPAKSAVNALKYHQSIRAVQQIREREYLKGMVRLFRYGSLLSLLQLYFSK
jgi:glycosyltransferase involved in cell wall biosynthesis